MHISIHAHSLTTRKVLGRKLRPEGFLTRPPPSGILHPVRPRPARLPPRLPARPGFRPIGRDRWERLGPCWTGGTGPITAWMDGPARSRAMTGPPAFGLGFSTPRASGPARLVRPSPRRALPTQVGFHPRIAHPVHADRLRHRARIADHDRRRNVSHHMQLARAHRTHSRMTLSPRTCAKAFDGH